MDVLMAQNIKRLKIRCVTAQLDICTDKRRQWDEFCHPDEEKY